MSRHFAAPAYRQEQPAQEPLDGDDRLLSSTTGRFRLYEGDRVVQHEADVALILSKYAPFGLTDPTIQQLREGFALVLGMKTQLRLVQLAIDEPKIAPEPEPVDEELAELTRDPWSHLDDPDDVGALPKMQPMGYRQGELKQYHD